MMVETKFPLPDVVRFRSKFVPKTNAKLWREIPSALRKLLRILFRFQKKLAASNQSQNVEKKQSGTKNQMQ